MADLRSTKVFGDLTVTNDAEVKSNLSVGGVISGDGSGITSLDAENLVGKIPAANLDAVVSQNEAETGTSTTSRRWTAQRVRQAIAAWWNSHSSSIGKSLATASTAQEARQIIGATTGGDVTDQLGQLAFLDEATQAQSIAGTSDSVGMTPLRDRQALQQFGLWQSSLPTYSANDVQSEIGAICWFRMDSDDPANTIHSGGVLVMHLRHSAEYAAQVAYSYGSGGKSWRRAQSQGVWGDWQEAWDTSNLPQSSINNWNTAFGWGNHASAGYLTSVTWADVSSKPAQATRWPTFAEVTGKPATYPPTIGTTATTAVAGNDSRLTNSREWTASVVSQAEAEAGTATTARKWTAQRVRQAIAAWWSSYSSVTGRAVVTAADASAARAAIGAGTSNLTIGTTASTAAAGNDSRIVNGQTAYGWGNHASAGYLTSVSWSDVGSKPTTATRWPTFAEVTGKPSTYAPTIGTTASTAKAGNWVPAWGDVTGKPAQATRWPTFAEVTGKPSTYAPTIGTTASTAKAGNWLPSWGDIQSKPAVIAGGSTQEVARGVIGAAQKSSTVVANSSRSLVVSDLEKILTNNTAGTTYTLPNLGNIGVPIVIHTFSNGVSLVPGAGMTLRASMGGSSLTGTRTIAPWSVVTIYQTDAAHWEMFGSGIS